MSKKQETRNKIMKVALKLFSEQGYYATPTKLIASEAGVNELTLFRHFGTKENLFQETTEAYVAEINIKKEISELIKQDFEASVIDLAKDYLDFCFENKKLYKIQLRLKDDEKNFVRLKLSREFAEGLTEYFQKCILNETIHGNPEVMATTFINSILGAFTVYLLTEDSFTDIPLETLVEEHARQFANYYRI